MYIKRTAILAAALIGFSGVGFSGAAFAGPVETLDRERAVLIETMLSPTITAQERQDKITTAKHRLTDLERVVLRDKSLVQQNSAIVRKAFANYDLTFLVHASTEHDKSIVDHWLETVKVSTHSLMNARVGRR